MDIFMRVNTKLLPLKVHFFVFLTAMACVLPFRTVFAKQLGLSATAVSIIFFAAPILKMLVNPQCGVILDYFKRFRLTISVIMIILAISHFVLIYVPIRTTNMEHESKKFEKKFKADIQYLCSNESEHTIKILSAFDSLKNVEETLFDCDLECSKPKSESLTDLKKCTDDLKVKLTTSVFVSECYANVKLITGKIIKVKKDGSDSIYVHTDEKSMLYQTTKSTNLYSNCSKGVKLGYKPQSSSNEEQKDDAQKKTQQVRNYLRNGNGNVSDKMRNTSILNTYLIKDSWVENCPCMLKLECRTARCYTELLSNSTDNQTVSIPVEELESEYVSVQFWTLFTLLTISNLTNSALFFMMNALSYELLNEEKGKYGHQRLWGTVGWGLGALIGGYVNEIASSDLSNIDYGPCIYISVVLVMLDLIPIYKLKITDVNYSSYIWKDVCSLFVKADIIYNIIIIYFVGVLSGFIWNFQFWFMEEIGSNQTLLGLSQTVECIFELPWFVVSGWVIHKIGHDNVNTITLLSFGLRYLCFAYMNDPWMTLPVSILQGPCFGLFYSSMTMYSKVKAPPGTEATIQSLVHLSFDGFGIATGIILGGMGIDYFGSRMTFILSALLSFTLFVINIIATIIIPQLKKRNQRRTEIIGLSENERTISKS